MSSPSYNFLDFAVISVPSKSSLWLKKTPYNGYFGKGLFEEYISFRALKNTLLKIHIVVKKKKKTPEYTQFIEDER